MDTILIEELVVRCIIGVGEEERREKQDVLIDIALGHDARPASRSDLLADAVDYRAIKRKVEAMAGGSQYHLVEALAERIAEICLEDPRVVEAQVTVRKPSAFGAARSAGVRIVRSRTSPA